jgi:Domain of unknown function (DUF4412)
MDRPRLGWLWASALFVVAGCKGKTSSGGEAEAGAAPPSATASAAPTPSPSASAPPTVLSTLMGFEGEIDMTAKGSDPGKPPQPVGMLVKGDKLRLDVIPGTDAANTLGGKAFLLVRVADKKLDVVTDARKQVVELDLTNPEVMKTIQKSASSPGHPAKPEPPPKLTKTGTKETIAGYPCEDWEVASAKDNKKKASLCVASLPSTFFHIPLTGVPGEYGFALELIDGQHFPLRVVGYDEHTGAESGRLEVTKLDPHPVDAAKFEIPAGYKTVDMLQMFQAFSNAHVPGMPSGMPGMPGMPGTPGVPNPRHGHH